VVGVAVFAVDAMLVVKIIPKKCVAGTAALALNKKKIFHENPGGEVHLHFTQHFN
jgi:hypothetical protein